MTLIKEVKDFKGTKGHVTQEVNKFIVGQVIALAKKGMTPSKDNFSILSETGNDDNFEVSLEYINAL